MKEKLSTTGMGTHSPHSFWNGKLATKFNVKVFFWIVWHSFFVFVFLALINGFAGFRFHLLHLYGIENGILYSVFLLLRFPTDLEIMHMF